LKDNTPWGAGVPSRVHGFTRKACPITSLEQDPLLGEMIVKIVRWITLEHIVKTLNRASINANNVLNFVEIGGIYLNNYENGQHYTPTHSHPDSIQLVISLGATRTLTVNSKKYELKNGDIIMFGSQKHGVPKDPTCTEGRISIAMFLRFNF
jgi:tRNA(Leu) C34 or U34 (ribose-2'-O)-methylase TrmL